MQQIMDNLASNVPPEDSSQLPQSFFRAIEHLPLQYFRVITRPSVETLSTEVSRASWDIVVVQLIILVALTVTFNWLGHLIPLAALHSLATFSIGSFRTFGWLPAPFNSILFLLGTFFIGLGTAYPFSKLSKGSGRFVEHIYILLLFTVPLVTLSGVILLIPATGLLVALLTWVVFVLFLYRLILHALTIMAVHRLKARVAILIVLIIPILIMLIGLIYIVAAGGADIDIDILAKAGQQKKQKRT